MSHVDCVERRTWHCGLKGGEKQRRKGKEELASLEQRKSSG
jgi:hypothetical protein